VNMIHGFERDECRMVERLTRGWKCRGCGEWNDEEVGAPEAQPCNDCGRLRDIKGGSKAGSRPYRVRG